MPDGLRDHERAQLYAVLASVPEVSTVYLYGSRALGTSKPGSDVDLAIDGEGLTQRHMALLAGRLDELPLPFRYDVTLLAAIANPDLRKHIDRHGVVFWQRTADQAVQLPSRHR